jgi:hypothetical protein
VQLDFKSAFVIFPNLDQGGIIKKDNKKKTPF